jgi:hypothetical protein
MKSSVLILCFLLSTLVSNALVRTVSNNPNSPGQYTSVTTAYTAANVGDTLYVVGSLTSYGGLSITKRITIIGSGYNPNKQNSLPTSFANLSISRTLSGDPSGTQLIGIKSGVVVLSGYNGVSPSLRLSGIGMIRCDIGAINLQVDVGSFSLLNSILGYFYPSYVINGTYNFYNNIITTYINSYGLGGEYNIYNNLFISNSGNALGTSTSNMNVFNTNWN